MTAGELQAVSGFALGVASAAIMLALVYVRRALQSQREARALLEGAWASFMEVAARRALADGRVSLKCRIYGPQPHQPCSGTTDDGDNAPCECWCHETLSAGRGLYYAGVRAGGDRLTLR